VPLGAKAERPSDALVPRLLALFGSPVEDAKCLAVAILNLLAGGMPQALADNMATCARGAAPAPPDRPAQLRMACCHCARACVMTGSISPHARWTARTVRRSSVQPDRGAQRLRPPALRPWCPSGQRAERCSCRAPARAHAPPPPPRSWRPDA
jgi:hypothetical protein